MLRRWIGPISLRNKVAAACVTLLLCTAAGDVFVLERVAMSEASSARLRDESLPGIRLTTGLIGLTERLRLSQVLIILFPETWDRSRPEAAALRLYKESDSAIAEYARTEEGNAVGRRLAATLTADWAAFGAVESETRAMMRRGVPNAETWTVFARSQAAFDQLRESIKAAADHEIAEALLDTSSSETVDRVSHNGILALLAGFTVLWGLAALGMIFGVLQPVRRLAEAMARLSRRDTQGAVPGALRRDEVGDMARSLEVFRSALIEQERLTAERAQAANDKAQSASRMALLLADFKVMADRMAAAIGTSATTLQDTSSALQIGATRTRQQADAVSTSAEEASGCVVGAAANAEELEVSIAEIGRQLERSAKIAGRAAHGAEQTDQIVRALSDRAREVGRVVSLIGSIAEQTNLLALNATIEAARSGDAGRGFAVVASEVRSLASQTARATDDIAGQIGRMQATTTEAVQAIGNIVDVIAGVMEMAEQASAAVEQQQAVTRRIAQQVHQAACGTSDVSGAIALVGRASALTSDAASRVQSEAGELSHQAEVLRTGVSDFLAVVSAA